MQVTVNVEDINLADVINQYTDKTLAEALVESLVQRIVQDDSYKGIAERVRQIRDEEIRAQLAPLIAEAIAAPVQLTNTWGERTGGTTTLREVVIQQARTYLNESSDSYNRQKGSRLEVEVRKAVDAAFKDEIAEAVKIVRETVSKQFGLQVADAVDAAVRQALSAR